MAKMFQVKTLQALAACTVVNESIPIFPSSIPSTMFEELQTLYSLFCLRKHEKVLDEKIDRLKVERQKAIEKSDDCHMDSSVLRAGFSHVGALGTSHDSRQWGPLS